MSASDLSIPVHVIDFDLQSAFNRPSQIFVAYMISQEFYGSAKTAYITIKELQNPMLLRSDNANKTHAYLAK